MRIRVKDEYSVEIRGESHTLLNILRWAIGEFDKHREIELIGYTIPHPMEDLSLFRIQFADPKLQTKENLLKHLKSGLDCTIALLDGINNKL